MELLRPDQQERTGESRRRVAEEIYAEISLAVQRLLDDEQLEDTHSSVVELRNEQQMALRALSHFSLTEQPAQAA